MAKLREDIAIVLGVQVDEDTILAAVRDATEVGIVQAGAAALGLLIRDESLTMDVERIEELGQEFPATFSRTEGSKLRLEAAAFSFDVTVKGSGQTTGTPTAGDFDLPPGIKELLQGAGLVEGTPTATNTPYPIGVPAFLTIKVWRDDQSFTWKSCRVTSIAWAFTPG